MEIQKIKTHKLKRNDGEIAGLPRNPRTWSEKELDALCESMKETPELTEVRGCIVVPHKDNYLVLGGNMRCAAAKKLGWKEITCIVMPETTPVAKLREIVLKDNSSFGMWDMDALANEWDNGKLPDWGVPVPVIATEGDEEREKKKSCEKKDKEKTERLIITFPKDMKEALEKVIGREYDPANCIVNINDLNE